MSEEQEITQAALDMVIKNLSPTQQDALADAFTDGMGNMWARGSVRTMNVMVSDDMLIWEWSDGACNPRAKLTRFGIALRMRILAVRAGIAS